MPPAARITDMHVCPMVTPGVPPIPHVGGPILPPGVPTVLIGFLPAATVTNMATCVGPPDIIAKGSTGVFINFLPAARMGDTCAHGGTIVLGEPTVMIGEIGSPAPGAGGAGAVMAGLVVAGLLNPANSGSYSALLSAAGKQGTPPAAYTPPTYTPPPGPILVDAAAVAPADAPAAASALDPNLPETDYDGVLVGTNCQPLTTKSSPGDHLTEDQIDTAWQSAYVSNSPCCQSLRASGQSPTRIAYVNGIDTDRATQCVTLQKIANMTCAPVLGVHNATNGTVKDLWQSHQDKNLIDKARAGKAFPTFDGRNPAVDTLTDIMTNSVISGEPTALWAHSQGGDILSLASYQADTELKVGGYPSGISGLQATTMASAAQNYPPDLSATHFINIQDFVPTWLGIGKNPKSDPANTGPNQNVIRFEGAPGASNPTFLSDQDMTNMLKKNFSIGPFGNLQYQDSAPPVSIKAFHDVDTTYLNAIRAKDGGCPPDD